MHMRLTYRSIYKQFANKGQYCLIKKRMFSGNVQEVTPKMLLVKVFALIYIFEEGCCNWISDWMNPVKEQLGNEPQLRVNADAGLVFNTEELKAVKDHGQDSPTAVSYPKEPLPGAVLEEQLVSVLSNAKALAETLNKQISLLVERENLLKEVITNGRFGTTAATISLLERTPKTYIIRDGQWFLCRGIVQFPLARSDSNINLFNDLFTTPRCIGQEVPTVMDMCAFTSIIRYETIPTKRKLEYTEEDFLCLKSTFNNTFEQYHSVPKKTINETCKNGNVRSLVDNIAQCGIRMLSEYSYYPHKSSAAAFLPLEYCTENDGSCKLTIGWHIANTTTESFETLKKDPSFKKFFINQSVFLENAV